MTVTFAPAMLRLPIAWLNRQRYRFANRLAHWQRALAYGRGTLTPSQAFWMIDDCEHVAGSYSLQSLDVSGVIELAQVYFQDHPALERLAEEATASVAQKWSGNDDAISAAQDWAVDLIGEYAVANGVELVRTGD